MFNQDMYSGPFALWQDLRQFITQTKLNLLSESEEKYVLVDFKKEKTKLTASNPVENLPEELVWFIRHSAQFIRKIISKHEGDQCDCSRLSWTGAGAAYLGTGIERWIIANELGRSLKIDEEKIINGFGKDIIGILSFLSQTSQRRYEKNMPHLTVEYDPKNSSENNYGVLGKKILDEYHALLRLCRDGHTILVVREGLYIVDILDDVALDRDRIAYGDTPIPKRLMHLQQRTQKKESAIIFNLNPNATIEIICQGKTLFRFVNGVWRFLLLDEAFDIINSEMGDKGDALVAHNIISLALDLADRGEGALLFLCNEPTDDVINKLILPGEGLIKTIPGMPYQELTVRTRFTQLIGSRKLNLKDKLYYKITPLLSDLCSIDGCTVFTYNGELLGFGCIVQQAPVNPKTVSRAEGSRTSAAKQISKKGIAIKVSSDGVAILYIHGKEWGNIW
jgi:hypothetical protein